MLAQNVQYITPRLVIQLFSTLTLQQLARAAHQLKSERSKYTTSTRKDSPHILVLSPEFPVALKTQSSDAHERSRALFSRSANESVLRCHEHPANQRQGSRHVRLAQSRAGGVDNDAHFLRRAPLGNSPHGEPRRQLDLEVGRADIPPLRVVEAVDERLATGRKLFLRDIEMADAVEERDMRGEVASWRCRGCLADFGQEEQR